MSPAAQRKIAALFLTQAIVHYSEASIVPNSPLNLDAVSCQVGYCQWERQRSVDNTLDQSVSLGSPLTLPHGFEACYTVPYDLNIGRIRLPMACNYTGHSQLRAVLTPLSANGSTFNYERTGQTQAATTWLMHDLAPFPDFRYVNIEVGLRQGLAITSGHVSGVCVRIDLLDEYNQRRPFVMPTVPQNTPYSRYQWGLIATRANVTEMDGNGSIAYGSGMSRQLPLIIHSFASPPGPSPSPTQSTVPAPTSTETASATASESWTVIPSSSLTASATESSSRTASQSVSPTASSSTSASVTAEVTPTGTMSPSVSPSSNVSPSRTASAPGTPSGSASKSGTPPVTPSKSGTQSVTPSKSATTSMTQSKSSTTSRTASQTVSQSPSVTASSSASAAQTPSGSATLIPIIYTVTTLASQFDRPMSVGVMPDGTVLVSDFSTIRKVSTTGIVSAFVGNAVSGNANGQGTSATVEAPYKTVMDNAGNYYFPDSNYNQIRKISSGGTVTTFAGRTDGGFGTADSTGTSAQFRSPSGLALSTTGILYVSDLMNHRIRAITSTAATTTLAGSTSGYTAGTGTAAKFNMPGGLSVDGFGNIWVADTINHAIRKVTPAGVVTNFAGTGASGTADGIGTAASFHAPSDVTVTSDGSLLFVMDGSYTIRRVTSAGVVTTVAGSPTSTTSLDGIGTSATFYGTTGIVLYANHTLYVAESNNGKVRKVTF